MDLDRNKENKKTSAEIKRVAGEAAYTCFGVVGMANIPGTDGIVYLLGSNDMTKGVKIAVSDDELKDVKVGNYTFRPNYASRELTTASYVLNGEGSSYDKAEATTTIPFRPYFTSGGDVRTRSIVFGDENTEFGSEEKRSHTGQDLIITTREHKIIVESQLRYVTDVRIVNPAGITMKTFTIKPGEVVETFMINAGVYIVQTTDARYTRKLAVK